MPADPLFRHVLVFHDDDLPETQLDVQTVPLDAGSVRVLVRGELDCATAPQLRDRLDDLIRSGCHNLELDFAETTFCDVAGLTALLHAARQVRPDGGGVLVRSPCRSLVRMMDALRLDERLEPRA